MEPTLSSDVDSADSDDSDDSVSGLCKDTLDKSNVHSNLFYKFVLQITDQKLIGLHRL